MPDRYAKQLFHAIRKWNVHGIMTAYRGAARPVCREVAHDSQKIARN
jgi:hypothetical protein